jgi:deoxyribonuclease-1
MKLFRSIVILCFFILFSYSAGATSKTPSFQGIKKIAGQIWADHRVDIYCECEFDAHYQVNWDSCGYEPEDLPRAERIEWEHIVPVSWFGSTRRCWQQEMCVRGNQQRFKGRECCEAKDSHFREMSADLHNLIPVVGEINKDRRAYRFSEFEKKGHHIHHGCKMLISDHHRAAEPRDEIKGLIARAHFYMMDTYDVSISKSQKAMFTRWNNTYPPSDWEREWNRRVTSAQGKDNKYISGYSN